MHPLKSALAQSYPLLIWFLVFILVYSQRGIGFATEGESPRFPLVTQTTERRLALWNQNLDVSSKEKLFVIRSPSSDQLEGSLRNESNAGSIFIRTKPKG
jgi:hypothetical protein